MPLDPNIALQVRAPADPMEAYGRAISLKSLMGQQSMQDMQLEQARQQQEQERTLADLYRGNIGPDGQVNRQGVTSAMAQRGLGGRIPGVQKQWAEADKAGAELGQVKAKTAVDEIKAAHEKAKYVGDTMARLASNPNITHDDVIRGLRDVPPEFAEDAARFVRAMPSDPRQLRQYLIMVGLEADKRLAAVAPKFQAIDAGDRVLTGSVDPLTGAWTQQGTPASPAASAPNPAPGVVRKGATPGQQMLQDRFEARASRAGGGSSGGQKAPTGYRWAAGGALEPIPGGPADKGPGAGGKPLTEGQSNALMFAGRMESANAEIDGLAAKGVLMPSVLKQTAENLPLIGGMAGAAVNFTQSEQQQQVEQAKRNFINALLRKESGAVIGDSEFRNADRQYFPQSGDSPAVIEQKRRNRVQAQRLMLEAVPHEYRAAARETPPTPAAQPPRGGSQPARPQQQRAPTVSNW